MGNIILSGLCRDHYKEMGLGFRSSFLAKQSQASRGSTQDERVDPTWDFNEIIYPERRHSEQHSVGTAPTSNCQIISGLR